jgi:hypothetical protein
MSPSVVKWRFQSDRWIEWRDVDLGKRHGTLPTDPVTDTYYGPAAGRWKPVVLPKAKLHFGIPMESAFFGIGSLAS